MMRRIFFLLAIILMTTEAYADWAARDDAPYRVLLEESHVTVYADATSSQNVKIRAKIQNQDGRRFWASYVTVYNSNKSKLRIIRAYTLNHGHRYDVLPGSIEDKTLSSAPSTFDQLRQVLIAFPKLEVGAEVYLEYQMTTVTPFVPDFFSDAYLFGRYDYLERAQITVDSELPLYFEVNDPKHSLVIKTDKKTGFKHLEVNLRHPVFSQVVNEENFVDPKHWTVLVISSLNHWQALADKIAPGFWQVIKQPLPPLFESIKKVASKASTDSAVINQVTSRLAESIQYLTDVRTALSGITPHALADVASMGLGDCKDYTSSTAAILLQLGFKVTPALVLRGEKARTLPTHLPSPLYFNHAILRVQKHGRTYWIDATNKVSMAGNGMFPDIAGKPVLVLDKVGQVLQRLPTIDAQHNVISSRDEWYLLRHDLYRAQGQLLLKGESALKLSGLGLHLSTATIASAILHLLDSEYLPAKSHVDLPNLSDRIVHNLELEFDYTGPQSKVYTNLGVGLSIRDLPEVERLLALEPHRVSDIYLGPPQTTQISSRLQHIKAKQLANLNASIVSPWLEISRELR